MRVSRCNFKLADAPTSGKALAEGSGQSATCTPVPMLTLCMQADSLKCSYGRVFSFNLVRP